ncbi:TIGR03087 family PEP-CTERM/XrtA system glycosyltransferase [Nitrogeniibacter mangrovi]|uniref:TIGR03087 family PEP-CTERM/XrtA system glycosyltransferase n=1 Tax=Nitrogeniibacter mangrovi TaxID=2016596 RepID=A0A6C1B6V3_9RHOO|nr:TIGR03087 family PEP-CTERM/XrtA system glycosyltransferase [Nitrogeniibacter mangrovi]QID18545.1 TIGR03087 family PEP-CTERM/XrtA system glycosyltransferase [Nitrogeniibacter mangrovi]
MSKPPLLYLVHRIPYPPNKGDKVRSFHLLKHLAERFEVHLGTFVDHPDDWQHVPALDRWCASVRVAALSPRLGRLRSLTGLLTGEALTLPFYRDRGLAEWVRQTQRACGIDRVVVFSGAMAQYLEDLPVTQTFIDFCDVDSAKWSTYGQSRPWPLSWLYRREGRLLGQFERQWAKRADHTSFVTRAETELFLTAAPTLRDKTVVVENGVDAEFFSPANGGASPFEGDGPHLVFSGAMDYWPNVDAACWFADEVLPQLRRRHPGAQFHVVGMNPAPSVLALAKRDGVHVTGTVPDVRPYIHHADVVVAPLRVARGIQNKVLEAMAMGRPVVASSACARGLRGTPGLTHEEATSVDEYVAAVDRCLGEGGASMGRRAREAVLQAYAWPAHLGLVTQCLLTEVSA